jgi:hypothetical protein
VLQAAELALDGGAAPVQGGEPLGVTRDKRVAAVGLDPAGLRPAVAGAGLTSPRSLSSSGVGVSAHDLCRSLAEFVSGEISCFDAPVPGSGTRADRLV